VAGLAEPIRVNIGFETGVVDQTNQLRCSIDPHAGLCMRHWVADPPRQTITHHDGAQIA
jgi:hypothetical protein